MAARVESLARQPALPPPLKWAGGKRWLVLRLPPLWMRSQAPRLVEPFCGALSVALGLAPEPQFH